MQLSEQAREFFVRLRQGLRSGGPPSTSSGPAREPVVRRMDFPFAEADIPRHWLGGSVVGTAIANGLNLVFPDGERFFIRSVNHFIDELDDPQLRDRCKRFYGQEGAHAREHERLNQILRDQGVDVDAFLVPYRRLAYELLAPQFSPKVRLSVTAALEHFTATFAEAALRTRMLDEVAPPVMTELLLWHAAEEIEHKDVAYEVLQRVDDSYALRIAGLVLATAALLGFWGMGVVMMLQQEEDYGPLDCAREYLATRSKHPGPGATMPAAVLQYLAPDFHPAQVPNDELARDYLASVGAL